MSSFRLKFKMLRAIGVISMLFVSSSACSLLKAKPKEAAVIEGTLSQFIRVDSEHGSFNGVFDEEIIYDAYLHEPYRNYDNFVLWITRDTKVYEEQDESKPVPFTELKRGAKVRAHVGEVDKRGDRPAAYAIKLIIFK
ncbi:MAG TPA: hypothetical protein VIQ24_19330 [Pyrinomonadaceae bacterium]